MRRNCLSSQLKAIGFNTSLIKGFSNSFQTIGKLHRGNCFTIFILNGGTWKSFSFFNKMSLLRLRVQVFWKDLGAKLLRIWCINLSCKNWTNFSKGKIPSFLNKGPVCALYLEFVMQRTAAFWFSIKGLKILFGAHEYIWIA